MVNFWEVYQVVYEWGQNAPEGGSVLDSEDNYWPDCVYLVTPLYSGCCIYSHILGLSLINLSRKSQFPFVCSLYIFVFNNSTLFGSYNRFISIFVSFYRSLELSQYKSFKGITNGQSIKSYSKVCCVIFSVLITVAHIVMVSTRKMHCRWNIVASKLKLRYWSCAYQRDGLVIVFVKFIY